MTDLHDLGVAYRKAKVDLYYSTHASLDAIANYEENLHANLSALQDKINGEDETWVTSPEFIGTWTLATKSVHMDVWTKRKKENGIGLIFASPIEEWEHALKALAKKNRQRNPKQNSE